MAVTYGTTDRCTGGTPSNATVFDNNTSTQVEYPVGSLPIRYSYDFGVGVAWKISKARLYVYQYAGLNAFKVQGSHNNFSNTVDLYSGNRTNNHDSWQDFTFKNKIAYRYVGIYCTSSFDGTFMRLAEIEMMEGIYPSSSVIQFFLS